MHTSLAVVRRRAVETGPSPELPWLPVWAVVAAHLAHGLSWALLIGFWATGRGWEGFQAFAWPHLAGLGWLSVLSLAVMFHVVPGFLDVRIPAERFARAMTMVAWVGAIGLAAGFWLERPDFLPRAGAVCLIGLIGTVIPLGLGVWSFRRDPHERVPRPPLRPVFLLVLAALVAAGILGLTLALGLVGWVALPVAIPDLAAAHMHLAGLGWLSLLVMGVSIKTLHRVLGAPRSRWHAASAVMTTAGTLLLGVSWALPGYAAGVGHDAERGYFFGLGYLAYWLGCGLAAIGMVTYACDTIGRVLGARGNHIPPRAYVAASAVYLLVAVFLGLGSAGGGRDWTAAYCFVAFAGWLGQTLNGHLLHMGTRFIATQVRGPDDETRPVALLSPTLSWSAFGLFQAAVVLGAAAALGAGPLVCGLAGAFGLAGWAVYSAGEIYAWRRARQAA